MEIPPEITKKQLSRYASLDSARHRRHEGIFVAEGSKCVLDLAKSFSPERIYAEAEWAAAHPEAGATVVSRGMLRQMTRLQTTPPVIAFFHLPAPAEAPQSIGEECILALDRVQDPGNLGTIIRTADWMGVRTIVASDDTVDVYNPKTVQATMGALGQMKICYVSTLGKWLSTLDKGIPVFGTFLGGENLFETDLSGGCVIVMGNEGQGISPEVETFVNRRITIPPGAPGAPAAESLNVATATAIVLARRMQCAYK